MEKFVYLIKATANDDSTVKYIGKNGVNIEDPFSSELFDFAKENGFETELDAYQAPISLFVIFGHFELTAKVVKLAVW